MGYTHTQDRPVSREWGYTHTPRQACEQGVGYTHTQGQACEQGVGYTHTHKTGPVSRGVGVHTHTYVRTYVCTYTRPMAYNNVHTYVHNSPSACCPPTCCRPLPPTLSLTAMRSISLSSSWVGREEGRSMCDSAGGIPDSSTSSIRRRVSLVAGWRRGRDSREGGARGLVSSNREEAFSFSELYKPSGSR